jgi:DNA-directed RNA polymerase subunit RPC12/RpoP
MAEPTLFKDGFVNASDIDHANVKCPGCGSTTLRLRGHSAMDRVEFVDNGKPIDFQVYEETDRFELEVIECDRCSSRWQVRTNELVRVIETNEELRQLVIRATGKDPWDVGCHA